MKIDNQEIYNWPNFVSFVRILLAPFLFFLAVKQEPIWFIVILKTKANLQTNSVQILKKSPEK